MSPSAGASAGRVLGKQCGESVGKWEQMMKQVGCSSPLWWGLWEMLSSTSSVVPHMSCCHCHLMGVSQRWMAVQDGGWSTSREKVKKSISNKGGEDFGPSCIDSAIAPLISRVSTVLQPSVTSHKRNWNGFSTQVWNVGARDKGNLSCWWCWPWPNEGVMCWWAGRRCCNAHGPADCSLGDRGKLWWVLCHESRTWEQKVALVVLAVGKVQVNFMDWETDGEVRTSKLWLHDASLSPLCVLLVFVCRL